MNQHAALAVCGFSGSGKTTLLEATIPRLIANGLSIAVVKHDAHGFDVDRAGKDSDRFFRAGATVALRGPTQQLQRRGASSALSLEATVADLARDHDLVLVEGHKDTRLPKIWLSNESGFPPPAEVSCVLNVLPWNSNRLEIFTSFLETWLPQVWSARPLFTGILLGENTYSGSDQKLSDFNGRLRREVIATFPWRSVPPVPVNNEIHSFPVLLGNGRVPRALRHAIRLPDPGGLSGPIAPLLAAHRWSPQATWIVSPFDQPWQSEFDIQGLAEHRRPGVWAVIPIQQDGLPYESFGLFEPQALNILERAVLERSPNRVRTTDLAGDPHTLTCSWRSLPLSSTQ